MRTATNKHSWGVLGHEGAVATLAYHIRSTRVQHAYLFTGPGEIGKHTLAVAFARVLLCEKESPPCSDVNECRSCALVSAHKHPDVSLLAPVISGRSAKITVGPIRELVRSFALRPVEATRRVAIISDFDSAGGAASDALLKTLEETPGNGVILLTAESPVGLAPTIVSRCALMTLRPLPRLLVQRGLSEYWGASEKQAEMLAHLSGGRLGWAVDSLSDESALEARTEHLDRLCKILTASSVERFACAEELSKDLASLVTALDLWTSWWRDVMHVASGASTTITNADRSKDVCGAADQLTAKEAASAVTSLLRTMAHIGRNANARLALEVLLLDLPRISLV